MAHLELSPPPTTSSSKSSKPIPSTTTTTSKRTKPKLLVTELKLTPTESGEYDASVVSVPVSALERLSQRTLNLWSELRVMLESIVSIPVESDVIAMEAASPVHAILHVLDLDIITQVFTLWHRFLTSTPYRHSLLDKHANSTIKSFVAEWQRWVSILSRVANRVNQEVQRWQLDSSHDADQESLHDPLSVASQYEKYVHAQRRALKAGVEQIKCVSKIVKELVGEVKKKD